MDTPKSTTESTQAGTALDPGDQPLSPDEEIAEIEKLLAGEPDDFQARCRLGELYFSKGRLDDALAEVKKSIEMAEGLRAVPKELLSVEVLKDFDAIAQLGPRVQPDKEILSLLQ